MTPEEWEEKCYPTINNIEWALRFMRNETVKERLNVVRSDYLKIVENTLEQHLKILRERM